MSVVAACLWSVAVFATDVGLLGLFPGKALLSINGGVPRSVAVGGRTEEGVGVLAVDSETATVAVDARTRVLRVGQNVVVSPVARGAVVQTMSADASGHFLTTGRINGVTVRFLVDTGASLVTIGASDARRIGIDVSKAPVGYAQTANGMTPVARVRLSSVTVGEIVLHEVDATVLPNDLPAVLLGMSFLNRMEMQRNGDTMTLKKNY